MMEFDQDFVKADDSEIQILIYLVVETLTRTADAHKRVTSTTEALTQLQSPGRPVFGTIARTVGRLSIFGF